MIGIQLDGSSSCFESYSQLVDTELSLIAAFNDYDDANRNDCQAILQKTQTHFLQLALASDKKSHDMTEKSAIYSIGFSVSSKEAYLHCNKLGLLCPLKFKFTIQCRLFEMNAVFCSDSVNGLVLWMLHLKKSILKMKNLFL